MSITKITINEINKFRTRRYNTPDFGAYIANITEKVKEKLDVSPTIILQCKLKNYETDSVSHTRS